MVLVICMSSDDVLYFYVKFHENTQTGFRLIERARNYYGQISKGNNFKNI